MFEVLFSLATDSSYSADIVHACLCIPSSGLLILEDQTELCGRVFFSCFSFFLYIVSVFLSSSVQLENRHLSYFSVEL